MCGCVCVCVDVWEPRLQSEERWCFLVMCCSSVVSNPNLWCDGQFSSENIYSTGRVVIPVISVL